jgi:hypothetical protein
MNGWPTTAPQDGAPSILRNDRQVRCALQNAGYTVRRARIRIEAGRFRPAFLRLHVAEYLRYGR